MHPTPINPATVASQQVASQQQKLARLIERFTGTDGIHTTALPSVDLFRASTLSDPYATVYEPSFCLIAQGSKEIMLGEHTYTYSTQDYLLVSVDLPITGRVIEASPSCPYLAVRVGINPADVGDILMQAQLPPLKEEPCQGQALQVSPLSPSLIDPVIRLLRLQETPHEIGVLYPLLAREILYRLLTGDQSGRLRQIAVSNSQIHRVARAIEWLKHNYRRSVRIEDMARIAHMSPSGFHQHFKEVTTLTPLQYQKQLRLQEARRLMLSEDIDAATVSHRVGYESPSQFSREYSRLFGAPPLRDINQLRGALVV